MLSTSTYVPSGLSTSTSTEIRYSSTTSTSTKYSGPNPDWGQNKHAHCSAIILLENGINIWTTRPQAYLLPHWKLLFIHQLTTPFPRYWLNAFSDHKSWWSLQHIKYISFELKMFYSIHETWIMSHMLSVIHVINMYVDLYSYFGNVDLNCRFLRLVVLNSYINVL